MDRVVGREMVSHWGRLPERRDFHVFQLWGVSSGLPLPYVNLHAFFSLIP